MPHFLATAVRRHSADRSRTMAARSMFIGARPIRTPSSFALRMPARTRSRIKSDSSSAIDPMRVRRAVPSARWYPRSLAGNENDAQTVELVHDLQEVLDAPRDRSKAATSTTENFFRRASAMSASSPGRLALFPEIPQSLILLHDLIATLRRKLAQIVKLRFDVLVRAD